MNEVILRVALDDIFNEAKTSDFIRFALIEVLQKEIEVFCENEDIPMGQVSMLKTLRTAQVTVTIEPFVGLGEGL